MIIGCAVWYFFLLLFGQSDTLLIGLILLCCAGYAQNICSVPMFVIMLKISEEAYRGRVMGIRMLAIYGLPMGLIIAGAMIDHIGFSLTNLIFVLTGLILLASISLIWRKDLLDTAAIANQK